MTALEEIKKAQEGVGPLKVEFTPDCDEFNAIIAPINDDYDGTFFTVIGCGDKQDKLGGFMAVAVNTVQELVDTIQSLQAKNEGLLKRAATAEKKLRGANTAFERERKLHLQNQQLNRTLEARAEAAEAEVKRLQAEIDRKSSMPGDHRYWEGRYREEAADNELLRSVLRTMAEVAGDVSESWPDDAQVVTEIGHFRRARTALASTGGEHHGN